MNSIKSLNEANTDSCKFINGWLVYRDEPIAKLW